MSPTRRSDELRAGRPDELARWVDRADEALRAVRPYITDPVLRATVDELVPPEDDTDDAHPAP